MIRSSPSLRTVIAASPGLCHGAWPSTLAAIASPVSTSPSTPFWRSPACPVSADATTLQSTSGPGAAWRPNS